MDQKKLIIWKGKRKEITMKSSKSKLPYPLNQLQLTTNYNQLTCTESRLVTSITAIIVIVAICRSGNALIICARKLTNWTLLVDTRRLLVLLRLFNAVNRCCCVAQVKYDNIDFVRVHFWCHFISLFFALLLAFVLRLILYCFEHFLS